MLPVISILLIFTSDNPAQFEYFSETFTKRLNSSNSFKILQDRKIENHFFLDSEKQLYASKFNEQIRQNIVRIKNLVKINDIKNAYDEAHKNVLYFKEGLQNYPYCLERKNLIEFYFWNAAAYVINSAAQEDDLNFLIDNFLSLTTLSDQQALLELLPPKQKVLFDRLIDLKEPSQFKLHTIRNKSDCKFYLNGHALHVNNNQFQAPVNSFLGAQCSNGNFTLALSTKTHQNISIKPSIKTQYDTQLPIEFFPIPALNKTDVQFVVYIHWSSKYHTIQTIVANSKHPDQKSELSLDLTAQNARNLAGQKIEDFILRQSQSLLN